MILETTTCVVSITGIASIKISTKALIGEELLSKSILIEIAASRNPRQRDPASPRQIDAGLLFQNRNPRQDEKIANDKAATKY